MTVSSVPRGEYTARPGAHPNPQEPHVDRLPTDVVEARLNHLIDRARRGALLPEEADRFTTELRDLVRRLEDTEDERDQYRADCQKWAGAVASAEKVRRIHAADADQYEAHLRTRITALEQRVTELTVGQCTHALAVCAQHHRVPMADCPYPRCIAARKQEAR